MIKKICVITPGYPSKEKPYSYTFVDQLICAIADNGLQVSVITPYDSLKAHSRKMRKWDRITPKHNIVHVYSPSAFTLTTRIIGPLNMSALSDKLFIKAVNDVIKTENINPDIIYSHFLFPAGMCASAIGHEMKIPSVCAFGESSLWSIREIGIKKARKRLSLLNGMIAVSTNNKDVLVANQLFPENKIRIIPNAVNKTVFCPGDKIEARKKLGLPLNNIIGLYNGSFSDSKGSLRVDKASEKIRELSMVYLGGGKEEPSGSNILYKGRVAHSDVPIWLKAADFFVLPTLAEGCCNAVIEAMATGLPIITSDRPFNYDILDKESAIMIDPLNIKDITIALKQLTTSEELRNTLSVASLKKAKNLDINIRALKIISFLNDIYNEY